MADHKKYCYRFNIEVTHLFLLEQCSFCKRTVVDEAGEKTEDFGSVVRGRHVCARCMKAFEYALGG